MARAHSAGAPLRFLGGQHAATNVAVEISLSRKLKLSIGVRDDRWLIWCGVGTILLAECVISDTTWFLYFD
jgi:hypothetical protein